MEEQNIIKINYLKYLAHIRKDVESFHFLRLFKEFNIYLTEHFITLQYESTLNINR